MRASILFLIIKINFPCIDLSWWWLLYVFIIELCWRVIVRMFED